MKIITLDTETSGLTEWKNGIWQVGGIIDNFGNQTRFDFKAQLSIDQEWNDIARKMCPYTDEEMQDWQSQPNLLMSLQEVLKSHVNPFDPKDKFFLVGYNIQFDERFLRQLWSTHKDPYFGSYFWTPCIDVMSLAADCLKSVRHDMPNFKLGTVAHWLNIHVEEDRLHDAMYDIELTREIYYKITNEQKSK